MTKETLQQAMELHKEIQECQKLLETLSHANAIMLVCSSVSRETPMREVSSRVTVQNISTPVQATLVVALSRRIDDLRQSLEDL